LVAHEILRAGTGHTSFFLVTSKVIWQAPALSEHMPAEAAGILKINHINIKETESTNSKRQRSHPALK